MTFENNLTQKRKNDTASIISNTIISVFWLLFIGNFGYLIYSFPNLVEWQYGNVFKVNGFTILIWTTVTFFSAVVSTYARSYLKGFKYHSKFMLLCLGFTLSVMFFVMANHVMPLLIAWLVMGIFMSRLIGVNSNWGEAKEAAKFAQKYFFIGSFLLGIGVLLLAIPLNEFTLSGLMYKLDGLPNYIVVIASLCIIMAAIIQSAMYPFHRWLLSAMTAPTPASALMHAGFVNGAGILLALFSTVLFASHTLYLLFVIGGLTAVIAQFTKLLQVNVKQKLACSTIAQMGFMIMQCGLGFFNAAVAHLILHGFYKAYLFLSAGGEIEHSKPKKQLKIKIKPFQAVVVVFFGVLGALLFTVLTGKSIGMDSGIFLTLIVAITVGQATYNIVKQKSISNFQKIIALPVMFIIGIGVYALIYNGVTILMESMPMVAVPMSLSVVEIVFGLIFLVGFFIMKLGGYRKVPWLYVKLLNVSQPHKKTILMYKTKSL